MKEKIQEHSSLQSLSNQNNDQLYKEEYVGQILYYDLCAYCHNMNIVEKLRRAAVHDKAFHVPAMLFTTGWFAYYGMMKTAIIIDIIRWVVLTLMPNGLFKVIAAFVWMVLTGFIAIPLYYKHINKIMNNRGLLMRADVKSEKISQSLAKEGQPSLKRALIYCVFLLLTIQCCNGIVEMIINAM